MLRNYLLVALRALLRQKLYSFINLSGLAVGLTCFLLIMLYVRDELSFDRFHSNADRIYRVAMEQTTESLTVENALSVAPLGPTLARDYPEVEEAVRILPSGHGTFLIRAGDKRFYESKVIYADAGFFSVFSFPLVSGDPHRALAQPYSIVLTRAMAQKYFGQEDPLGKSITLGGDEQYTVTGVAEEIPGNSHLMFDFLISFSTYSSTHPEQMTDWFWNPFYTYVLLRPGASPDELNVKIAGMVSTHASDLLREIHWQIRPFLQPLIAIHLHPLANDADGRGDITYVYLFGAIALLILLIGCVNFTNLSTARALTRVREVGLRKVVGATPAQLLRQFLGEAVLQSYLALVLAVILAELLLPLFGTLAGRTIGLAGADIPLAVAALVAIGLVTGLAAGIYPAFVITSLEPARSVKGTIAGGHKGMSLRRALVIIQFAIAIVLMIGTVTAYHQLTYMRTKKLGFDKEQMLVVPMQDSSVVARAPALKTELLKNPAILQVALASRPPGMGAIAMTVSRFGASSGQPSPVQLKFFYVDEEYIGTMGMTLAAGRDFSRAHTTDTESGVILNEEAARTLGWSDPQGAIGQQIAPLEGQEPWSVIGVVRDFNFQPLRVGMQPLMLRLDPQACEYFLIRARAHDVQAAVTAAGNVWASFSPEWPFAFSFLDEDLNSLYRSEERFGQMFASFSILAIVIACLGLFGLVAATTERRRKEIGVRKVLGASVAGLVLLFTRELALLVLAGNVIAWPLGWYGMSRWLEQFPYHAPLSLWAFFLAGLLALTIALVTVAGHAVRASTANPVESLRYE